MMSYRQKPVVARRDKDIFCLVAVIKSILDILFTSLDLHTDRNISMIVEYL